MRAVERDAIDVRGIPARTLMENAGRAIAEAALQRFGVPRRPLIAAGPGNNGGDGYVIARVLRERDPRVRPAVFALGRPERHTPEARENLDLLASEGIEVVLGGDPKDLEPLLAAADLVVDALFGVGLDRRLEGLPGEVLAALAMAQAPLLAVDLPSGMSSDTGELLGAELEPALIVTLGLPKLGLALRPARCDIWVADIGLPPASLDAVPIRQHTWTASAAAARRPVRGLAAHKGSFGHLLIAAGSEGKTGAAALAAEGALRAGAGLVTLAVPRGVHTILEVKTTEAMTLPLDDGEGASLAASAAARLLSEARARDALVVGPGLGTREGTVRCVRELLERYPGPAVVDADALNAFAGAPEALRGPGPRVLTPHPGEMGRLLGRTSAQVEADRPGAVRELAARSGAVSLLKGARTLISEPAGQLRINATGGPGLASGGSGDVLSGVLGALLGQGLDPFDAAALAAYLHGRAGELRPIGLLAHEMAAELPRVWSALGSEAEGDVCPGLRRFC
jgi:ADP-dependent NAD(P)H-hydrate dehydratase / NAD(P)H-hydrate epimerase